MGASQFDNQAVQLADGRTRVGGPQRFELPVGAVEYRFLLIQGDVAVKGFGRGQGSTWTGTTDPDQERLQEGPVLGIGLAIVADTGNRPGFQTFSWSQQLELVNG